MPNALNNEFDFSSVDSILPEEIPNGEKDETPVYDFSSVDKIDSVLKAPKKKSLPLDHSNLPQGSKEVGGLLRSGYGLRKAPTKGASTFHPAIDIHADFGNPVSPAEDGEIIEVGKRGGKGLSVSVLHSDGRITEYNHLSRIDVAKGDRVKKAAIIGRIGSTGISTGAHLDFRVKKNGRYVDPIQELDSDPKTEGIQLRLKASLPEEAQDISKFNFTEVDKIKDDKFDLSSIDQVEEDEKDYGEEAIPNLDLSMASDPLAIKSFEVAKKDVPFVLHQVTGGYRPRIIGKNPDQLGVKVTAKFPLPENWNIKTRPQMVLDNWLQSWNPQFKELNDKYRKETGGLNLLDLNDYKPEALGNNQYEFSARITPGAIAIIDSYNKHGIPGVLATQQLIRNQRKGFDQEYKAAQEQIAQGIKKHPYLESFASGVAQEIGSVTMLSSNIKSIGKAIALGNIYGYDSKEYTDAITKDEAEKESILGLEGSIYHPEDITGKVIAGVANAGAAMPRFVLAGKAFGPASLPVMSYLENLHLGNREAAKQALPMAIMAGVFHGGGEFLNAPSGTSAPFKRITNKNLSLFQNTIAKGEPITINNLTPLSRQLILRGSNAIALAGSSKLLQPEQSNKDLFSSILVGLFLPVGKGPREFKFESFSEPIIERTPLQLEAGKIEVGTNEHLVKLDLDTANLNLLELKRSLKEGTYKAGGENLSEDVTKQKAITDAIDVLEKAIPESTKKFFADNEEVIRAALKTNYEFQRTKAGFLENQNPKPEDIKFQENNEPLIDGKKNKLREDVGRNNIFTKPEKAEEILGNFFKITSNTNKLGVSIIPYGDILAKKVSDVSYLTAFLIEDSYHRGIEPTISLVRNRLRETLGDFGQHLKEDTLKEAFERGLDYFKSNTADPFFSRMKQDALEKLPNRLDSTQAMNFFSTHGNEFEWTSGLKEFLEGKIQRKERVYKKEVIDIINKGQVRVKESIASDEDYDKARVRIKEINKELISLEDETGINLLNSSNKTRYDSLKMELEELKLVQHTEYSPKWYAGELLELPGGKNTREVKLITPLKEGRYKSPHWDELDVVAHYNTTDRTTTDGIKTYFSEEFQSDWMHDIREKGISLTRQKRIELQDEHTRLTKQQNDRIFTGQKGTIEIYDRLNEINKILQADVGGVEPNPFMSHAWKELVFKRFLRDAATSKNNYEVVEKPLASGIKKYFIKLNDKSVSDEVGWKQFNSKEEAQYYIEILPKYKYEGIGWTTARQQQGRYGKILEGKDFEWKKNSDGTYSFYMRADGQLNANYHELQNISLERFAELTTKEAAEEVTFQENKIKKNRSTISNLPETDLTKYNTTTRDYNYQGRFSLKEAVELRSGIGQYSDYDVAFVNYAKKIGKRFGSKYSLKEIPTSSTTLNATSTVDYRLAQEAFDSGQDIYGKTLFEGEWEKIESKDQIPKYSQYRLGTDKIENIHFLEITPSMRESLSKEGFPLYGLGGNEKVKTQELGTRNNIVTREAFDQHRNDLVESLTSLENDISESDSISGQRTILNSGLSPDAFIDQTKLLYKGIKEFSDFSKQLITRFGESVNPFIQDLWIQVKDLGANYRKSFDLAIKDVKNAKDSPAFAARKFTEGGFVLARNKSQALKTYEQSNKKEFPLNLISLKLHRGISLAQLNSGFGSIYDIMRGGQRARNSFESSVLRNLHEANDFAKKGGDDLIAEAIFDGNQIGLIYTDQELIQGRRFNQDQIEAYRNIRKAVDLNLDWRKETKLYSLRERAIRLNNRLNQATAGTPAFDSLQNQLLDISDTINKITNHFEDLKKSGYISLQRQGDYAAFAEDPNYPIDDPKRKLYNHFDTKAAANKWLLELEANGMINTSFSEVKEPEQLRKVTANLTPGQFEDLLDNSGVNPHDPSIELLRDEVYSRFPSFGYELKREFTRGYDRTWKFVLDSIGHQTEIYANSFYSRVAGNESTKKLSEIGLHDSDYEMYKIAQSYIDDEISAPPRNVANRLTQRARKAVYYMNLGYDVSQLYLNAVAQPLSQTYSYFSRVEHEGIKLKGFEVEKYFAKGWKLAGEVAIDALKGTKYTDPEFRDIYDRLKLERVIEPEFNKDLLELESQKTVQSQTNKLTKGFFSTSQQEHWMGTFMRAGEKTTRTHVAAEAFLVGKEKFSLAGEELVNFIVRAVDATQTNPTRGENPYYVRQFGEVGKLLYQFNGFNHMWAENLALNVKADLQNRSIKNTARHIAPLLLMGGIRGLPLAGFAAGLYTILTGDDPKKEIADKHLGKDTNLELFALYGITQSPSISQKSTPSVPLLDNFRVADSIYDTVVDNAASGSVPLFSTAGQFIKGLDELLKGNKLKGAGMVAPRFIRNALVEERYKREGLVINKKTVINRNKFSSPALMGQVAGVSPKVVTDYYEKQKSKKLKILSKKLGLSK